MRASAKQIEMALPPVEMVERDVAAWIRHMQGGAIRKGGAVSERAGGRARGGGRQRVSARCFA